ncbi:MAG: SDR family oxidoreductase [Thermoplasmata archaeon]
MTGKLEGKLALITGGSRGIGRSIAELFVEEGAEVIINYSRSKSEAEELKKRFPEIIPFQADIGSFESVSKMADQIHKEIGEIDILVNNAGTMYLCSWENYDSIMVDRMFAINQMGPINTVRAFLNDLKKNRGNVINIASNAGIGTSADNTTFYAITKAGVIMLTKRLAFDMRGHGIRVNAIAPGWVKTEMTTGGKTPDQINYTEKWFRDRTTLGQTGKTEDIASAALFLASEDSSYMNGQVLVIDGGRVDNLTHGV